MPLEALIIEDDPAQCEIFTMAVRQAGYEVTCINDGDQGLEFLKTHSVRLIVLDLHLPGTGGEPIARAVRAMPHLTQTHIILATADSRTAETLQEISDLVLLKPVSYLQLRDLAARLK